MCVCVCVEKQLKGAGLTLLAKRSPCPNRRHPEHHSQDTTTERTDGSGQEQTRRCKRATVCLGMPQLMAPLSLNNASETHN